MEHHITTPFLAEDARALRAGDTVLITGVLYTARDAAHKRLVELLERGEALPCDLRDQIIYYVGPSPARPEQIIGAAGPTTSYRMDAYAPRLLQEAGLRGMVGKGKRTEPVLKAIRETQSIYFAALGGAAALLAGCVKSCTLVAYPELQSEALRRLEVVDFPALVVNDCHGGDLYQSGRAAYLASLAP